MLLRAIPFEIHPYTLHTYRFSLGSQDAQFPVVALECSKSTKIIGSSLLPSFGADDPFWIIHINNVITITVVADVGCKN